MYGIFPGKNKNKIPNNLADPILNAVLEDDSTKLSDLISNLDNFDARFYLTSKKLPDILSSGPTILCLCCFFGSTECFNLLRDIGASFEEGDDYGRKCIHFATAGGSLVMMRILDQFIEDNNSSENNNNNSDNNNNSSDDSDDDDNFDLIKKRMPFFIRRNLAKALYLNMKKSENYNNNIYNSQDDRGLTPMHYGAMFGRLEIVRYLWTKGASLDKIQDNQGNRPIYLACLYGHTDVVKFFVENNVKFESKNMINRLQPIHYACIGGYSDTIEYLISLSADINLMANSKTPIFYAARYGSLQAVQLLVKHGAKFNFKRRKNSPMVEAALGGHADIIHYFLQHGCDPNVYTSTGETPLMAAITGNNADVVKLLIQSGAKVDFEPTKRKQTSRSSKFIVEIDEGAAAKPLTSCQKRRKAKMERRRKMDALDKELIEINSFNLHGTADLLIAASRKCNPEIFKLILENIDVKKYIESDIELSNIKKRINREKYAIALEIKKDREAMGRRRRRIMGFRKHFHLGFDSDEEEEEEKNDAPPKCETETQTDKNETDKNENEKNETGKNEIEKNENEKNETEKNENEKNETEKNEDEKIEFDKSEDEKSEKEEEEEEEIDEDRKIYKRLCKHGYYSYSYHDSSLYSDPDCGRIHQIFSNIVDNHSFELLKLLIEKKLIPKNANKFYIKMANEGYVDMIEYMLDHDIPFKKSDLRLKEEIFNLGNVDLIEKFGQKGLKFDMKNDLRFISKIVSALNPDLLSFVLDKVLVDEKGNPIPAPLPSAASKHKRKKKCFHFSRFLGDDILPSYYYNNFSNDPINLVLSKALQLPNATIKRNYLMKKVNPSNSEQPLKPEESLKKILNILLDRGFKFNPEGSMFNILQCTSISEINYLFDLMKEIESRPDGRLNFENLKFSNVQDLFGQHELEKYIEFTDFLFDRGLSFKPKESDSEQQKNNYIKEINSKIAIVLRSISYKSKNRRNFSSNYRMYAKDRLISDSDSDNDLSFYDYESIYDLESMNDYDSDSDVVIINENNDPSKDKEEDEAKKKRKEEYEKKKKEKEEKNLIFQSNLMTYLLSHGIPILGRSLRLIEKIGHKTNNMELITLAFKNYVHLNLYNCEFLYLPHDEREDHKTPLELACKRGYYDIVVDLVSRGFSVNESGFGNYSSPLMFAIMSNNQKLINFLKSKHAQFPKNNPTCNRKLLRERDRVMAQLNDRFNPLFYQPSFYKRNANSSLSNNGTKKSNSNDTLNARFIHPFLNKFGGSQLSMPPPVNPPSALRLLPNIKQLLVQQPMMQKPISQQPAKQQTLLKLMNPQQENSPPVNKQANIPQMNQQVNQQPNVLQVNQQPNVPQMNQQVNQQMNVPQVNQQVNQQMNVPQVNQQVNQQPNVPQVNQQVNQQPNVPQVNQQVNQQMNVPQVNQQVNQQMNVLQVNQQVIQHPNAPQVNQQIMAGNIVNQADWNGLSFYVPVFTISTVNQEKK